MPQGAGVAAGFCSVFVRSISDTPEKGRGLRMEMGVELPLRARFV